MKPKLRPSENSLADFCTFPLLKAPKIKFLYAKKADSQAFRSEEVQKSARESLHGLDLKCITEIISTHCVIPE